jgi:hypothetical protein
MTRNHQPDQADFRVILPEDIDWNPFPAFPPGARLAVLVGHPTEPGPYVVRVKVPDGTKLMPHKHPEDRIYIHGYVGRFLHRARGDLRWREGEGLSAGKRDRSSRRNLAFPLGEVRRIRHSSNGNRSAWPRISRSERRSAPAQPLATLEATMLINAQRNDSSHDRPWSTATRKYRVLPGRS